MKKFLVIIFLTILLVNCARISPGKNTAITPEDTELVVGDWNTDRGENYYWKFYPDHTVRSGIRSTDIGFVGTWALSEYTGEPLFRLSFADEKIYNLTVVTIPAESMTGDGDAFVVMVHIINHDRIYLQFENGNGEFLDRAKNP